MQAELKGQHLKWSCACPSGYAELDGLEVEEVGGQDVVPQILTGAFGVEVRLS